MIDIRKSAAMQQALLEIIRGMDVSKLLLSIQDIQDVVQKELAQDNIRSIFCMASFRFPDIRASVF